MSSILKQVPSKNHPVLFDLADGWALGSDSRQWILLQVYFRHDRARYVPRAFIASTRDVLLRVMRETGIKPTPEAQVRLDCLPESFHDFMNDRLAGE